MEQIFNEASLSASLDSKYSALDALCHLGKASTMLEKLGLSRQIRVTSDFETRYLAPEYTMGDYLHSSLGGQNRTVQSLLRSRFSRAPYVEKLCEDMGITDLDDYYIEDNSCKGLALASLWGIPALSLKGSPRFVPPSVTLSHDVLCVSNDGRESIQSEEYRVGIVCEEADVALHEPDIICVLRSPLSDGMGVLEHASRLLPCLRFSFIAHAQLQKIDHGNIFFNRIRSILIELNRAMVEAKATSKNFSPQGFKFTPTESQSAIAGKMGVKHTFNFENNKQLLCESHMRISGGDRIYFRGEERDGIVYVGHIGEHLPTKKFG